MSENGQYIYVTDNHRKGTNYLDVSNDYGSTWTQAESNSNQQSFESIYTVGTGQYAVATDFDNVIYLTTDYGSTWSTINTNNVLAGYSRAIISSNGQDLVASDGDNNGYVYESFDGGQNWSADSTIGTGSGNGGWQAIAGSDDLSRLIATDNTGVDYLGYNSSLYVTPPGNNTNSNSTTQNSTSKTSQQAAPSDPDTGYGTPHNANRLSSYLLFLSIFSIVLGLIISNQPMKNFIRRLK
jgi:photosystem II stability/assembly factor-like uncharacterized protein